MSVQTKGNVDSSKTTNLVSVDKYKDFENLVEDTKTKVTELYSDGFVKSKFLVGEHLSKVKTQSQVYDKGAYDKLVNDLPFEKGQADKYVSLYSCEWARELVFGDSAHNFPDTFTTLYKLTQKKYSELEFVRDFLVDVFTTGVCEVEGKPFKTSHLTSSQFDKVVTVFSSGFGKPKNDNEEPTVQDVVDGLSDTKSEDKSSKDKSDDNKPTVVDQPKLKVLEVTVNPKTFDEDFYSWEKVVNYLTKLKCKDVSFTWNEKEVNQFTKESKARTAEKEFDDRRFPNSVVSKAS